MTLGPGSYSLLCACGRTISVAACQAGLPIECPACGAETLVPPLSVLSAPDDSKGGNNPVIATVVSKINW